MKTEMSSREFRDEIVGKRITGVIARPGRAGQPPVVLMLHFDDGSVVEFVSPRSDRLLKRSVGQGLPATDGLANLENVQLELMPMTKSGVGVHGPN